MSGKSSKRYSLIIHASHPVQYHAPLYREIYNKQGIDSMVVYCSDIGVRPLYQHEFMTTIKWDVSLLDGYNYVISRNYPVNQAGGFFSRVNPGIFRIVKRKKYDAILIQGYDNFSCWIAFIAAKISRIKIIWRGEATLRAHEIPPPWKKWLKRLILLRFFRACDAVMYSCSGNKEYLEYYGVPEYKLFPLPCAVDNAYFQNERKRYLDKRSDILEGLGIDRGDLVVLFSARFTSRKRPHDLLEAVNKLGHKDVTVLFVGDGIEKNSMESYALKHNIKAVFVGFQNQSELAKFYSIADIATVISDYDPSPKAMNEAMNFELPIIVTDIVGTAKDLVKHGENGFVVKVGDTDSIAAHIEYFYKDRGEVRRMGKKSLEIVGDWNFSEDAGWIEKAVQSVMGD